MMMSHTCLTDAEERRKATVSFEENSNTCLIDAGERRKAAVSFEENSHTEQQ